MADYLFDYDSRVPAGRVVFRLKNTGATPHHVVLVPLPEDLPPIEQQLGGSQRRFLERFAGIFDRPPGDTGTFAVDLVPGRRYAMVCSIVAEDGEPHWRKGMVTEFRPSESGG